MADLRISTTAAPLADVTTPLLVLQLFEREDQVVGAPAQLDTRMGGAISRVLERGDFRGKKNEALVLYPRGGEAGAERVLLVGAGKREQYTAERLRQSVGTAVRQAERLGVPALALFLGHVEQLSERMGPYHTGRTVVEAAVLAAWDYRELKTRPEEELPRARVEELTLLAADETDAAELERAAAFARVAAQAENRARELAVQPGNIVTPTHLASVAQELAREQGMKATVLDRAAMRR
ncbi:MAG: hypothetical protein HY703_13910, partial [Gemmatimonadetes bacterium]|nr:hypothetical protein [Gemmatimonadota bacterium]